MSSNPFPNMFWSAREILVAVFFEQGNDVVPQGTFESREIFDGATTLQQVRMSNLEIPGVPADMLANPLV